MTQKDKIKKLEEQNDLYKQFIITTHGQPALDRLEAEYAILKTNEVLEQETREMFRKKYRHNKDGHYDNDT